MIHPTPKDVGRRVELREDPDEDGRLGTLQGVGEAYVAVRLDGDCYDRMIRPHRLMWWDPPLPELPAPADRRGIVGVFLAFLGASLVPGAARRRRPQGLFRRSAP